LGSSGGSPQSHQPTPAPPSGSSSGTAEINPVTPAAPTELTVASVVDGDTIRLSSGQSVQLAQISAPSRANGDCYADHARAILGDLVAGSTVKLRSEPVLPRKDSYGRTVAYVMAGGENVNLQLVTKGAAAPYFYFGHQGRYANRLIKAATKAHHFHTGLWGVCSKTRLDPNHQLHTLGGKYKPPPKKPTCTPGYKPCLINHSGADYDCSGGTGNGPYYTKPGITYTVTGSDPYGLDSNHNGRGCETGGNGSGGGGGGTSGGGGGSSSNCTPGYSPCLVYHGGADYDCYGGGGNGPYYTAAGVVYKVTGSDPYGLDSNANGLGCE
jgi:endonuclease YncB( thermonuclease family)